MQKPGPGKLLFYLSISQRILARILLQAQKKPHDCGFLYVPNEGLD
jgi:hypothetical protein